uniref:Uncharacterized protein n=1 Tax=Anolis carolinensis TaxID=28377 RepID=A0A803TRJ3_ANOCA
RKKEGLRKRYFSGFHHTEPWQYINLIFAPTVYHFWYFVSQLKKMKKSSGVVCCTLHIKCVHIT